MKLSIKDFFSKSDQIRRNLCSDIYTIETKIRRFGYQGLISF